MARKRSPKREAERPGAPGDEDLAKERELYEASKEFLESEYLDKLGQGAPPRLHELLKASLRSSLEASPGSPASWSEKMTAALNMGLIAKEIIEEKRRVEARRIRDANYADQDAELVRWARAEKAAHPRLSLPQICQRHSAVERGERSWRTLRDRILPVAPELGATRRPKRKARSRAGVSKKMS